MKTVNNQTELSGMLGESVSVRKVGGRVVVKNRPKRKVGKPSEKQAALLKRFRKATQYGSLQVAKAASRALYGTGITPKKRTAYIVAVSDYLNAPIVESIDTIDYHGAVGDTIVVQASDDFKVTKLKIDIFNAGGAIIEEGEAVQNADNYNWEYKATAANPTLTGTKIRAVAYDRPGNKGTAEVVL